MSDAKKYGHWPHLDQLLKEAEELPGFAGNPRAQAQLLFALGHPDHGYWVLAPEHKQQLLSRVMKLVPRVRDAHEPLVVLEAIFKLFASAKPFENISRATKVAGHQPRDLRPDEEVYPTDGWIGMFNHWTRESDVPLAYYFWAAIGAIGTACRYNFFIDRGIDILRMNNYLIFVGKKATGKSSAMYAALDVLSHVNHQVFGWKPGHPLPPFQERHPWQVNLLPEDTNQETLVRVLQPTQLPSAGLFGTAQAPPNMPAIIHVDSTGLLAVDELATFLGKDNWAIQKRVPFLTRIYSGESYTYHTQKGGQIVLKNLAVSMIGNCTPDWMRDAITPLMFGGGFLDRTMVIYRTPLSGPQMFPTPQPRDPLVAASLAQFLTTLTCRTTYEELLATPEANDWYEWWYGRQYEFPDQRETSVKRRANHLWKLAGGLAISDDSIPMIQKKHFENAARIFDVEWQYFRQLLGIMESPIEADLMHHIEQVLLRNGAIEGKGQMMKNDLYRVLRSKRGLSPPTVRATPIIESLTEAGRVRHIYMAGKPPAEDEMMPDSTSKPRRHGEAFQLTKEAAADYDSKGNLIEQRVSTTKQGSEFEKPEQG